MNSSKSSRKKGKLFKASASVRPVLILIPKCGNDATRKKPQINTVYEERRNNPRQRTSTLSAAT